LLIEMLNATKLTLLISRNVVHNENLADVLNFISQEDIDWEIFSSLIQHHELLPITYILLKDKSGLIPPSIYKRLETGYFYSLANNMLLWDQFLAIARAFNDWDSPLTPLKGLSFIGDIYPDINYRSMVDIDILVREESLSLAGDILVNMGYNKCLGGLTEAYWRKKQCHIAFLKQLSPSRSVLVEVHWDLDFKRQIDPILPLLWKRTEEKNIEGQRIRFLSCEDTIFSLALHKRRFGNILSLKGVCDLACLINKFKSQINWEYILKWSRTSRIRTTLYFSLAQVNLIDDNIISKAVLKDLGVPYWKRQAIHKLIFKNTFSFADINKTYLMAHFLLYDSIWEPINYIINIPQEQFAKFYGFTPYSEKASLLHRMRLLYMPFGFNSPRRYVGAH